MLLLVLCLTSFHPYFCLLRQLKGESSHLDEAEGSTLGAVGLSEPGEGVLEVGAEVCQCMQSWTIDQEHWRFLASVERTV